MAGKKKETGPRSERVVPHIEQGTSRVSRAAGSLGAHGDQQMRVEQRSHIPANKPGVRNQNASRQTQRAKASPGTKKSQTPRAAATPLPSPNAKDTQFIKWAGNKWQAMEPHHQQRLFSIVLLILSLLLFGSLTIFHSVPILSALDKFFLTFFGWAAYPLAIGLVAFAVAHLIEGIRNKHIIRWSMVIGLVVIWLLLLIESRLIIGQHLAVGVLAEVLVIPWLGWPPAVAHVVTLGLLLIAIFVTFRIRFGHILLVAHFCKRLLADSRPTSAHTTTSPSPYLGQRPQYSRYSSGKPATAALPHNQTAQAAKLRPPIEEEIEQDNEDAITFESNFEDNDPLNDINIHKQHVGLVQRGQRVPQPLDLDEHVTSVRGANQQTLPFDENEHQPLKVASKLPIAPTSMEPLAPNPRRTNKGKAYAIDSVPAGPVIVSPWQLPETVMLHHPEEVKLQRFGDDTSTLAKTIQDTLRSFRVEAEVRPEDISIGPTVIRFGIRPTGKPEMKRDEKTGKMVPVCDTAGNIIYETRTRVSRIMALQNDLALVLEAKTIRMEAPVPGRPYIGVEIPNKNSRLVTLREVLESKEYAAAKAKSKLTLGLGKDVGGLVRVADLARMPHLLIAGATGAGKCLAYDEGVFLADGRVVKVQDLVGQSAQVIGVTDTQKMQQTPALATFTENGVQDVFEIKLDNGLILCRTGEHPLWAASLDKNQHVGRQPNGKSTRRTRAINEGWILAKDLRICGNRPHFDGHVLLCPLALQQQGTIAQSDADVIVCAALLAEEGLNHYDHLTYMRTPRFTNADPLMVELVGGAVKGYGCRLVLSQAKNKGPIDYYISQPTRKGRGLGNPVARLVYEWKINCLATQKSIPNWVFQLPNEQVALFLRVFIDCDGWFDATIDHTVGVNVTLANPVLVQQIGQLALRLGIVGSYRYRNNGYAGAWSWSSPMVDIWQEQVGSTVKAEKLARAVKEQSRQYELAATDWNAWRRAQPLIHQTFANCPQGYEWHKIMSIRCITAPTVNIEVHSENHVFVGHVVEHNSVCINTIIASVLTQATPDDVRMLMVDPKMVELSMYNGIPHLLSPVVTEVDRVVPLLRNAISEMERRYRLFSQLGVRNLDGYRKLRLEKIGKGDTSLNNLPAIVIIIDELADLMMAAPEEVESMICRLAQLARATGIHLVIATQRPSVDVITGLIKANIPTRISFMVSSSIDSRTIIDMGGAERLLGRGDMLYLPADAGRPERIQGAFLDDDEAEVLVTYWRQQVIAHAVVLGQEKATPEPPHVEPGWEIKEEAVDDFELDDDLLDKAEEIVREYGRASISLLQRRLRIGYSRAARLIDLLEDQGIIGQSESAGRGREVLEHGPGHAGNYARQAGNEGRSLASEADDIMAEERARDEFLHKQAAKSTPPQQQQHHSAAPTHGDEEG